jgi:hypothetical protein
MKACNKKKNEKPEGGEKILRQASIAAEATYAVAGVGIEIGVTRPREYPAFHMLELLDISIRNISVQV